MDIVRLENVEKIYLMGKVEVPALRGIDIDIERGEYVSIIGPSGSGKSTIMNLIGCLDRPTRGRVFIDGKDVSKLNGNTLAKIRRKKIGFVFQQFNLIPRLTALENVELPMWFAGVPKIKRVEKAAELLRTVGLGGRIKHKPAELSGGELQRVAIARALSNDPEIILADEPTGNLDSASGDEIVQLLRKLNEEGKTIILVTHDPEYAKRAKRVIQLRDGKVLHRDLEFVSAESEYFSSHDTSPIPPHLLSQIDSLTGGKIVTGVYEALHTADELFKDVEKYFWYMSDDFPRYYLPKVEKKLDEGVEFKVIFPKDLVTTLLPTLSKKIREGVEVRVLDEVKMTVNANDSYVNVGLPEKEGKIDHDVIIFGYNPRFKKWCKGVFEYYWEKAEPFRG
ncbi:MAG: ATP-binding cassette domain-containing protein [Candidatus Hydrothermarchaeales archaeon]